MVGRHGPRPEQEESAVEDRHLLTRKRAATTTPTRTSSPSRRKSGHCARFSSPCRLRRGITVNIGADNAAKDKAASLRDRALAGESYEKLAADFSDSPSKSNAGLIGPITSTDVSPDLRKLFDAMKVGDITQPLRIPTGYQILKLESRSDAQTAPFEQAKDQISDRVFTDKRKDEYEKYMEKLRAQALIEWKNADLKKAYDIGVQQVKDGTAPLK